MDFLKHIFGILFITLIGYNNGNYFTCNLSGEVLDRKNGNLFLYRPESSRFDKDTIPIINGKFHTNISLKQPEVYWLFFEEDENDDGVFTAIQFFLEPGNVNISISYEHISDYKIQGSKNNDELYLIESKIHQINQLNNDVASKYFELVEKNDSLKLNKLIQQSDSLDKIREQIIKSRITETTDLISSYYLWLMRYMIEPEEIKILKEPLAEKFPESRYIIETNAFVNGIGESQVSQTLKDYKLTKMDLNEGSLHDEIKKSNYSLIVFWSSRCSSSDDKIRTYKKLYDSYKNSGFEIIGVAEDYDLTRWQNAIKRNNATWINLNDYDGEKAVDEYFHSALDGDILVDNKGIIQARIKSIDELKQILDELIK